MRHFFYLIVKSITNISGRPLAALTSFLSLLLLLLMFDLVWISALTSARYLESITTDIDMEVFIDDSLPDSTVSNILISIADMDGIAGAEYISKEDARDILYSLIGSDLLDGFEENPLPRSIVITFAPEYQGSVYLAELADNIDNLPGIDEIYYPKEWLEKIESTRGLVLKIVIFLGIIIALAVVLNLLYSIRLSARSRGQELLQHRLLGAGRSFLSFPFIIEGIAYALSAAAAGWLIIYYSATQLTFANIEIVFPVKLEVVYFFLAVLLVGMFGGYTGIRRSLR